MIAKTPTLMIGLGGIGSEIVEKVEGKTQDKKNKHRTYTRDNIQFVIIDTDENSIRERKKSGYRGYYVSLGGNVSVGKCLEWDKEAREEWFPQNNIFQHKSISEGAGQVRAVSRLAFQRAIRIGALKPMYEAISSLYRQTESSTNQQLNIVLVCTIAGGTGSGTILPLAIHLKEYIKKNYSGSQVKIDTCLVLPDILDSLKSTNNERDNLYANGYAALKEMSYFMHRTDNKINDEGVFVKLPDDEGHGIVKYMESPFDFCFVFGRLTTKTKVLGSLETYKEAIERCIYTQFVGSYSRNFFSIEDNMVIGNIDSIDVERCNGNTKKKIVLARFVAANCFKVMYPYEFIVEYLSLHWGLDIMAAEWRKYDEDIKAYNRLQREKQDKGLAIVAKTESESFVEAVERFKDKDEYSREIIKADKKDGEPHPFLVEFDKHMEDAITEEIRLWRRINDELKGLDNKNVKNESVQAFFKYHAVIDETVNVIKEKVESDIQYDVMRLHEDEEEWKAYYIESYLKNEKTQDWKSPNEIRYFLAKRVTELEEKYKFAQDSKRKYRDKFMQYDKELFRIENSKEFMRVQKSSKKKSYKQRDKNTIKVTMQNILSCSEKLLRAEVSAVLYLELKKYLEELLVSYQKYFEEYENTIVCFQRRLNELEKWFYDEVDGINQLVCTNEECLKQMIETMKEKRMYFNIGGSVSVWLYTFCSSKWNRSANFSNSQKQEDVMKEMWMEMFRKHFGELFDMNLFEAFSKEKEYKGENMDDDTYIELKLQRAATDFSAPLISVCRKEFGINDAVCIYSPKLEMGMSYHEVKDRFFHNGKAVCDIDELDTDKSSIIFYQNRYGIESFMLDLVLTDTGLNDNFPLGAGYRAYRNVLKRIVGCEDKADITPHIDNTWHRKEIMPDMNEKMEIEYFKWALKACFVEKQEFKRESIWEYVWDIAKAKEVYMKNISTLSNFDRTSAEEKMVADIYALKENGSEEFNARLEKACQLALDEMFPNT